MTFLNANGGQIIIGVDDNGNVIGVDKIDETLKKYLISSLCRLSQIRRKKLGRNLNLILERFL